jgi:hypothetical protein
MDYHELHKLTVAKLREMAQQYEDVKGTSGMHKDELVDLLCQRLGIQKPHVVVAGIDKAKIKSEIRKYRKLRDEGLAAHDRQKLDTARHKIHRLRRQLRKHLRITA